MKQLQGKRRKPSIPSLVGSKKEGDSIRESHRGSLQGLLTWRWLNEANYMGQLCLLAGWVPEAAGSSAGGYSGLQPLRLWRLHVLTKPCTSPLLRDSPVSTLILGAINCLALPREWVDRLWQ